MDKQQVKEYLRVDFDEDDRIIEQMMSAAENYIIAAVGKYDSDNEKANMLYLALVQDLYDNRTLMVTEQQKKRMSYTFASIILQLQLQSQEVIEGESIREG